MVARLEQVITKSVHIVEVKSSQVGEMKALDSGGGGGGGAPTYKGKTDFIPSDSKQVVPVGGYLMDKNITISAIPSNYGRLSWNGSTLTVY